MVLMIKNLLCLMLFAPAPIYSEPIDKRHIPESQSAATRTYLTASKANLSKLTSLANSGAEKSGSRWAAACKGATSALAKIDAAEGGSEFKKWWAEEERAWANMSSIGADLAQFNRNVVNLTYMIEDEVQSSTRILEDLQKQGVRIAEKLKGASAQFQKASSGIDKIQSLSPAEIDSDTAEELLGGVGRALASANKILGRTDIAFRGFMVRFKKTSERKRSFLKSAEGRANLRRFGGLKSKRLDPDQSGVFAKAEQEIEAAIGDNIERYQDALSDWHAVNSVFEAGADEFATTFILPPIKKALYGPIETATGLPVSKIVSIAKKDPDDMLADIAEAIKKGGRAVYHNVKGTVDDRILAGLTTLEEERRLVIEEHRQTIEDLLASYRQKELEHSDECAKIQSNLQTQITALEEDIRKEQAKDDADSRYVARVRGQISKLEKDKIVERRLAVRSRDRLRKVELERPRAVASKDLAEKIKSIQEREEAYG